MALGMSFKVKPRMVPIVAGKPKDDLCYRPSIELTGKGNLLCYDGYGSRWFRSSEKAVREAVDFFIRDYQDGNTLSYSDLYALLGISQSAFGRQFGYSQDERYAVDLKFVIEYIDKDHLGKYDDIWPIWNELNEDILLIEPEPGSMPYEAYWII